MHDQVTAQMASDLGISDLPAEEQQRLIGQFGEVALKAATLAVIEKLPNEKREEFIRLSEAGDAAALAAFLDRELPGHDELAKAAVASEVQRFKEST